MPVGSIMSFMSSFSLQVNKSKTSCYNKTSASINTFLTSLMLALPTKFTWQFMKHVAFDISKYLTFYLWKKLWKCLNCWIYALYTIRSVEDKWHRKFMQNFNPNIDWAKQSNYTYFLLLVGRTLKAEIIISYFPDHNRQPETKNAMQYWR